MRKPYELTLDLYDARETRTNIVYVERDRDTMPLYINLRKRGNPLPLPDDAAIVINIEQANGTRYPRYGIIVDHANAKIRWDVDQADVSVVGKVRASITVVSGEERLSYAGLTYTVTESYADGQSEPPDPLVPWQEDVVTQLSDHDARIANIEATGGTGVDLSDYATIEYVDDRIDAVEPPDVDLSDYATTQYVDEQVSGIEIPDVDLSDYYTSAEVDDKIAAVEQMPGPPGPPGEDGYTPVKGVDYFDGQDGEPGADGKAATITIGQVTDGDEASVTNVGTETEAVLEFVLPRGEPGAPGTGGGGDLPWVSGHFQDRSLAAATYTTITPVYGQGDQSLLSDNRLVAPSDGVYLMSVAQGLGSSQSDKITSIYFNTDATSSNPIVQATAVLSSATPCPAITVSRYMLSGEYMSLVLRSSTAQSQIGTDIRSMRFVFSRVK